MPTPIADMADFVTTEDTSAADRSLSVRFSMQSRIDHQATEKEGRPIHKDVEFITILIPGDKTLTINRPVRKSDMARFPTQYAAFKAQRGAVVTGTPLSGWPLITESQRRELEYFNIVTVEQLADVNDSFAGTMMGVHQLKQAAQRYITAAKEKAPLIQFTKAMEERDTQIAALQDQLNKLLGMIETQQKAAAPELPKNATLTLKGK
jgi:hypothetical protein